MQRTKDAVETREDARFRGMEGETVLGVFVNGAPRGYIRKLPAEDGCTFPWQGFNYPMGFRCGPKMTGSFYGPKGKDQAIASVLA